MRRQVLLGLLTPRPTQRRYRRRGSVPRHRSNAPRRRDKTTNSSCHHRAAVGQRRRVAAEEGAARDQRIIHSEMTKYTIVDQIIVRQLDQSDARRQVLARSGFCCLSTGCACQVMSESRCALYSQFRTRPALCNNAHASNLEQTAKLAMKQYVVYCSQ